MSELHDLCNETFGASQVDSLLKIQLKENEQMSFNADMYLSKITKGRKIMSDPRSVDQLKIEKVLNGYTVHVVAYGVVGVDNDTMVFSTRKSLHIAIDDFLDDAVRAAKKYKKRII